jgi:hypothetical protein
MAVHWGGRGPGHMARGFGGFYAYSSDSPSLWIDFVGSVGEESLSLDFVGGEYSSFDRDPANPDGFVMIEVWQ